jgi:hypothetical protein
VFCHFDHGGRQVHCKIARILTFDAHDERYEPSYATANLVNVGSILQVENMDELIEEHVHALVEVAVHTCEIIPLLPQLVQSQDLALLLKLLVLHTDYFYNELRYIRKY